jgi:hypothetical protein
VYEDLYKSSDVENEKADTHLAIIIKSIFMAKKEYTASNGIWVQSVFETIFDTSNLFTKVNTDAVDTWANMIIDTKMVITD